MMQYGMDLWALQNRTERALSNEETREKHLVLLAETEWPCVNLRDDYADICENLFDTLTHEAGCSADQGYSCVTVIIAIPQYPESTKQRERLQQLLCADLGASLQIEFYSGRKNDCSAPGFDGQAALQATLRW